MHLITGRIWYKRYVKHSFLQVFFCLLFLIASLRLVAVITVLLSKKKIAPAKLLVTPSFIPNQQASKDKQI